jgi:hypothetical protein
MMRAGLEAQERRSDSQPERGEQSLHARGAVAAVAEGNRRQTNAARVRRRRAPSAANSRCTLEGLSRRLLRATAAKNTEDAMTAWTMTIRQRSILVTMVAAAIAGASLMMAQQPPAQPPAGAPAAGGQPPGGQRGPRGPLVDPMDFADTTGFTPIFDGASLKGWDGDPSVWRAEAGTIVGETTAANPLKANTFLIWRGGKPGDFELKLEYRMNSTNTGVQYRSSELPDKGKWVLKGYQADIDFNNQWTGQLYEEQGRQFLALRGQATQVLEGKKARVIGSLESADALKALIKSNDWNQFHIIARGNTLVHIVNGHVTAVIVDDDPKGRAMSGLIGFQIHVGPPMKVEYRNVLLKNL